MLAYEQIVGLELVSMRMALGTEPLLLIRKHMEGLRALQPEFHEPNYIRIIGQIEAQGDAIRANQYGTKMREYDDNIALMMVPKKHGQVGYMLDQLEKEKGVEHMNTLLVERRLKFHPQFVSIGKRAFVPHANPVNRRIMISTLRDEAMRLHYVIVKGHQTKKISGKDGPSKQDDGITTLFVGVYKSNQLRRARRMDL